MNNSPNHQVMKAVKEIVALEQEKQKVIEEYLPAFQNVLARKKSLKMQEGETE